MVYGSAGDLEGPQREAGVATLAVFVESFRTVQFQGTAVVPRSTKSCSSA
jgi:hypothetical protein